MRLEVETYIAGWRHPGATTSGEDFEALYFATLQDFGRAFEPQPHRINSQFWACSGSPSRNGNLQSIERMG